MQRPKPEDVTLSDILSTAGLSYALIANLPGGAVFVVDRNLRYLLAEGEALAIAGFTPEDFVGQTIFEVLPPELTASYEPLYRQALAGESFEHEHDAHEHTYISRGTPLRSANGEVYAVLVVSYDITDRKRAEAAAASDLKDMQRLHELSARLVVEDNIQTLYQEIVATAIAFTGANAGSIQILDEATQDLVLSATQGITPAMFEHFHRVNADSNTPCGIALTTGKRTFVDFDAPENEDPHGSMRMHVEVGLLSAQSTPLINRSGKAIGMFSTHWRKHHRPTERELRFLDLLARQAADLIEHRQAQANLRESEEKFRNVFETIEEGFCIIEVLFDDAGEPFDYRFLETNQWFQKQTGLDNAIGKTVREFAPTHEQYWFDIYGRVARTGESVRFENEAKAIGFIYDVYAFRVGAPGENRVAVVFHDITERRRQETALRESEEKYRSLFNSIDEGFCIFELLFDDEGNAVDWIYREANPAFEQQTGYINPIGKRISEFQPDLERSWFEQFAAVARTGESMRFVQYTKAMDRWYDVYALRVSAAGNNRVSLLFTDVTDRKQREQQQAFLLKFSDTLRTEPNADAVANRALQMLIEQLQLDRSYITTYYLADNRADLNYQIGNDSVPPLPDHFVLSDFPEALKATFEGTLVIEDDWERQGLSEAEKRNSHNLGMRAMVAATLRKENHPLWSMVAMSSRPRRWKSAEIALVEEVAERTWVAVERAKAEAALRHADERYRAMTDNVPVLIWETDDSGLIFSNRHYTDFFGVSFEEVREMGWAEFLHPDDVEGYTAAYQKAFERRESYSYECRFRRADGEYRWLLNTGHPLNENRFVGFSADITENKRTETALRESEEKYRSLFQSMDEGYFLCDVILDDHDQPVDLFYIDENPSATRMTGQSFRGRRLRDIDPNYEEYWYEIFGRVAQTGQSEQLVKYAEPDQIWYDFHVFKVGSNDTRRVAVVFNDITDRKRAEEQQAFLFKFSDALRAEPDADAIANRAIQMLIEQLQLDRSYITSYYLDVNRADLNYQIGNDSVPPLPDHFVLSDFPEALKATFEGTLVIEDDWERQGLSEAEKRNSHNLGMRAMVAATLRKENHPLWSMVAISSRPRRWKSAEIALVEEVAERTWVAIDRARAEAALRELELQRVREQAVLEQERKRAETLADLDRAKTTFFSNVSHEFRTPLTLSLAPLQDALSDRTHPLDPVQRERLELVHRNSLRLLKLVNTLLDFSRIEAGRMEAVYEPTDLATYTAELASVFRSAIERAGLQLIVDCPPLPELVFVDREMWEKIVLNLLSNAFKFTFEGEIRVSLHSTDRHQAILQIQDTGTGIAPEHLPHLFERFYQVRSTQARTHEGSGIGLALVHELVRLQGGTIEVSSTVGEGTYFTIALPFGTKHLPSDRLHFEGDRYPVRTLASTAMGATAYVEEAERWVPEGNGEASIPALYSLLPIPPSARVLVVDDNADMREYLTRILSEHVQVEAVADGATVLAVAQAQVPDLILSDVMMPGLDGFELLEALRDDPRTREIPIILLSARAGEEAIVEGLEAGADDYLIKPFSAQELISRVTAHLQMAQLRGEALQEARSTLRSRDEFISVVSHELNTPLVSILGWTRMLRSSPPNPVMLSKALDTIERNATLQAKLVQDLLDLSRISAGKLRLDPQPIELKPVIEAAIATIAQTAANKGIELNWQENVIESLVVMGDGDRLSQVLINLLTNAIKFTPESGSVTLELSVVNNDGSTDASYAEIRVTDTGIGIAANFLPHVFDRFRQAEGAHAAKGLGLGLAIARHIVELHDGTIHADSAGEGQGATFTVRLPLLQDGGS